MSDTLNINVLTALEPLSALTPARIKELLGYCHVETTPTGGNPFANLNLHGQSVYLIRGQMDVHFADGNRVNFSADSVWARHPIGKRQPPILWGQALSEVQLLLINDELIDQLTTWDQFSYQEDSQSHAVDQRQQPLAQRLLSSGMFSAENLKQGPFAHLPPANIGLLLERIDMVAVWENEVIVKEGEPGDYYYVIETGRAEVTRTVGGVKMQLAEIKAQDVFGEEALIANGVRNATVTMKSNGVLLRLNKADFLELMQKPLLHYVNFAQAQQKAQLGAQWLDVRYPPEFRHDHLPGAINIPLNDIRSAIGVLALNVPYLVYCQSGRRSAAAAFILARAGYQVDVLQEGLWSIPKAAGSTAQ